MARTLQEIETEIIVGVQATGLGIKLTSTSATAIWRLFVFIIASSIWALEKLWDIFKLETETEMARQKPHTKDWYRNKALGFLLGMPVIPGTDEFDTGSATEEEIAAAKVIKQAACVKLISGNGYGILRIKVATANTSGTLQQVDTTTFNALKHYILRYVVDAGTQVRITTGQADELKLKVDIYYDPLVLSTTGSRLDNSDNTPVQDAINNFLQSIEFNGMLVLSDLEKALRIVDGVKIATVKEAASKYGNFDYTDISSPNVGLIDEIRVADSGYMRIDELEINWKQIPE